MYLQRLLQVNMATLVALGTLLLGMGQDDSTMPVPLPLLVLIAAIASVWLTDVTGWFRLNPAVANVAALVAVAVSVKEILTYFGGGVEVLKVVNVLIYLQIILLFREKDERAYWQLAMLSLFQVVVAAALFQGIWFGVLLVVYMLLGFSTLALMFLNRQFSRHRPANQSPQQRKGDRSNLPERPGGCFAQIGPVPFSLRWPLASQTSTLSSVPAGPSRSAAGAELFGRLGIMGLGTLGLTLVLFFAVPRFGSTAFRAPSTRVQSVVGFSDQVTLGELGRIIESREEVMRVRLAHHTSGRPYQVRGELDLRGAVLTHYRNGKWRGETRPPPSEELPAVPPPPNRPLILQKIEIEPLKQRELFCIWPFVTLAENDGTQYWPRLRRLKRKGRNSRKRLPYELGTTAFVDGVQVDLVPCDEVVVAERLPRRPRLLYRPETPHVPPPPNLPNLKALADQWIEESLLPTSDRLTLVRSLAWKLRQSGRFQYTLEGQERDPDIDPIEDFLVNNPRGHCEYFATALALMLQSQGISARVVVGYKCDEWNSIGNYYKVRQLHAHAWVEAYLAKEHIPTELLHGDDPQRWATGGWLRLEPTPGALGLGADRAAGSIIERIERRLHRLQDLWADYVMEMDRQRQRQAIYLPVIRGVAHVINRLRHFDWRWPAFLSGEKDNAKDAGRPGGTWRHWLVGGILLLLSGLILVISVRWLRGARRRVWGRLAGRADPTASGDGTSVEFYRRLEALLASHGLVRPAGQTQHEFAAVAGAHVAESSGRPQLGCLPQQIVNAFYRVRFGSLPLDSSRAEAVEHALAQLADCGPMAEGPSPPFRRRKP